MPERAAGVITGSARLAALAGRAGPAPSSRREQEPSPALCEMCAEMLADPHRHTLDLQDHRVMCVCRACSILLDSEAAGGGHFRLIPTRRLRLEGFRLEDHTWDSLRIPVELAYFFFDSSQDRVRAFYPSPMGPTESQLAFGMWTDLTAANPILAGMTPDVEALLVDRSRSRRNYWIVPIDECYRLVGLMRIHWKGLAGGKEVWEKIDGYFETLGRRSQPAPGPVADNKGG
ncbi:MAG TPA: DUF5947 family protein [Actinomycetota bacterium]|nr:DUF5947 family protein [Actinomycetota bacterium]